MKREIREKRSNLLKKARGLRDLQFAEENERGDKITKEQDAMYKKYKFYDNLIKIEEKMRKEKEK